MAAATAGLAAVALAGAVVYLAASIHAAASTAQVAPSPAPAASITSTRTLTQAPPALCAAQGQPVLLDGELTKFLKQAAHQPLSTSSAYSSTITVQVGSTTYGVIVENPSTGQASCYQAKG